MRTTLALAAAILLASPVAFTGCDRTAETTSVSKDVAPDGSTKVTEKKQTTDLNNGATVTEKKSETVVNH
jgi:hypothetical protein